jgi:hypothetical protein
VAIHSKKKVYYYQQKTKMEKILELQRRAFRKEKNKFLDTVEEKLTEYGYEFERKQFGNIIKSVNLETKCENPEFIFMAHYDTGQMIPFWMGWLMKLFGHNHLGLSIIFIYFFFYFSRTVFIHSCHFISFDITLHTLIMLTLLIILIPNKNNVDDNTSGVISLLSLAKKCKENGIENVKFIFVDTEEMGLFGSREHKRYLEKEKLISPNCKIISIDCVGGIAKFPLIVRNSKSDYAEIFQQEVQKVFENCKSVHSFIPFSDNYSFRKYGALNISFVNNAIVPGGYSLPNVHSPKDVHIDLPRIEKLTYALMNIINLENQKS